MNQQEQIDQLKAENARLTRELAELTEYTNTVKQTLFALIDQRDQLKETIATNEQCFNLQLEAVANDRDHLKALLDRASVTARY